MNEREFESWLIQLLPQCDPDYLENIMDRFFKDETEITITRYNYEYKCEDDEI